MSEAVHLIGFALDVSGSMQGNIQNLDGGEETRLDSVRNALDTLIEEADRLTSASTRSEASSSLYFFAYAFGLRALGVEYVDLFRLLEARDDLRALSSPDEDEIRRRYREFIDRRAKELQRKYEVRLRHDERGVAIEVMGYSARRLLGMERHEAERVLRRELEQHIEEKVKADVRYRVEQDLSTQLNKLLSEDMTLSLTELSDRWAAFREGVSMSNKFLGGGTPMKSVLETLNERFDRELARHRHAECTLFIISDGDATDGDPRGPAHALTQAGIKIVSCFVSSHNVLGARRLYATPDQDWPAGARAMFDMASVLSEGSPEAEYLERIGWNASAGSRVFAQINQSEPLAEFMNVVVAPIEAELRG